MKEYFEKVPIDCWLHDGRSLGQENFCISMYAKADAVAILLLAIQELVLEGTLAKRKLTFQSNRTNALRSMRIQYSPISNELRKFSVAVVDGMLVLEFTQDGVDDLMRTLEQWKMGAEDFCLQTQGKKTELGEKDRNSTAVWFWVTMSP